MLIIRPKIVVSAALGCLLACSSNPGGDGPPNVGDPPSIEPVTIDEQPVHPDAVMGPNSNQSYTPDQNGSSGVTTDDEGRLILQPSTNTTRRNNSLWVSNSAENTVSCVNTDSLEETGRYHAGRGGSSDPSRTSVDAMGDVFVGNRGDSSVTKIVGDATSGRCKDRNGNGHIDTSEGPDDVYDRAASNDEVPGVAAGKSTDECVVWTKVLHNALPGCPCQGIRAVAASPSGVWVGCRNSKSVYQIDGDTGEALACYPNLPAAPYGFVLDSKGRLWISGRGGGVNGVYWLDTATGVTKAAGSLDDPYGIAVDGSDNIWVAKMGGDICRFTPGSPPESGTWTCLQESSDYSFGSQFRGIAADVDGFVWAINTNNAVSRTVAIDSRKFPAANSVLDWYDLGADGSNPGGGRGVAIDFKGHVWGISDNGCSRGGNSGLGCASRLAVDRSNPAAPVISPTADVVPVGEGPYVYSDMIGYNLLNFATKDGWYRQTFNVCGALETDWHKLAFSAATPANTSINVQARAADSEADLTTAQWFPVVSLPGEASPVALPEALPNGKYIELEVRLHTTSDEGLTPSLGQVGFSFTCIPTNPGYLP